MTAATGTPPVSGLWPYTGQGAEADSSVWRPPSKWARHWLRLRLSRPHTDFTSWVAGCPMTFNCTLAAGSYHEFTWIVWFEGDPAPKRIVYKAPFSRAFTVNTQTYFSKFWFELDTSTNSNVAAGTVVFTGTPTVNIPVNTVFTKGGITYFTTAAGQIQANGSTQPIAARSSSVTQGPNTNQDIGAVFTRTTVLSGVDSVVTGATAFTGGSWPLGAASIYWRGLLVLDGHNWPANMEDDTVLVQAPVR